MARTVIATLQPVWDCRWSRPGHRITGVTEDLQPESRWVCVRDGTRRNVTEHECATCAYWELEPAAPLASAAAATAPAAAAAADTTLRRTPGRLVDLATRIVMLVTAIGLFAGGIFVLDEALMIPVSVSFWACAAVLTGLALFGRIGGHGPLVPPRVY